MRFFVTCAKGTEGPLRRELVDLRIRGPRGDTGGVSFEGSFEDGLKVCLWSRVAMRVLLEVGAFEAATADDLYRGVRAIDWRDHLDTERTLAVSATVKDNPVLAHTGFAALKVKDALVDAVRDRLGARPNVDPKDPDVAVALHLRGREARLFLDLAGEPLHRRGYRVAMTEAPLKETLAAAVLVLGGADPTLPFIDPMAGSGTLVIEQALRARNMAPGVGRRFGFERWPGHAQHAPVWQRLRDEARALVRPQAEAPISAWDASPTAVTAARRNAEAAGVAADISFGVRDVRELRFSDPAGTVCTNPPYGLRLDAEPATPGGPTSRPGPNGPQRNGGRDVAGRDFRQAPQPRFSGGRDPRGTRPAPDPRGRASDARGMRPNDSRGMHPTRDSRGDAEEILPLYEALATVFAKTGNWRLVVLSGNPLFSRIFLRKPDVSHRLWNGPIEVRLLAYGPRK